MSTGYPPRVQRHIRVTRTQLIPVARDGGLDLLGRAHQTDNSEHSHMRFNSTCTLELSRRAQSAAYAIWLLDRSRAKLDLSDSISGSATCPPHFLDY